MLSLLSGLMTDACINTDLFLMRLIPTFLQTTINGNIDLDKLFGGIMDIIIMIAFYTGIVMVAGGVYNLAMAYKDEDGNAHTKAIRYLVAGAILIGLPALLKMTGIINAAVVTMI